MTPTVHTNGNARKGCHCARCDRRRRKNTRWRLRRVERALEAAQMRSTTCPRRQGSGKCGGQLETYIDAAAGGTTRVRCLGCERRRRGICRDCDARVEGSVGRAIRCAEHKRIFRNECTARWTEVNHAIVLEKARAYYRGDADVRRRRNEYKRAWRKENRDKVREQKRRYVLKHANDPKSAYRRYHRNYRKRFREHHREAMRQRYRAEHPAKAAPKCTRCAKSTRWRPLPGAGRPWTVCTPCLFPCERKVRLAARRRARKRAVELLAARPKPHRIRRPSTMVPAYGPGRERLCLGGCGRVLTHRKKKCTACKALDAARATESLAPVRGRGRRTDLQPRRRQTQERAA